MINEYDGTYEQSGGDVYNDDNYNVSPVSSISGNNSNNTKPVLLSSWPPDSYVTYLNGTSDNDTELVRHICGYPAFCSKEYFEKCVNATLDNCDACDIGSAAVFAVFAVVLGLLILIGNLLVIGSVVNDKNRNRTSKIRSSLAFADMSTGFVLLVIVIYNFSWTINSTSSHVKEVHFELRGSGKAIAGGIFYLLGFTASLYHLLFLGIQRLYAIAWPMKYNMQSNRNFLIGMASVWILSIVSATTPLWYGGEVKFAYYSMVFLYLPTPNNYELGNQINVASLIMTIVFSALPYVFMTMMSIATTVLIRYRFQSSSSIRGKQSTQIHKLEIAAFKTLAVMQIGFSLTIVPLILSQCLFFLGIFDCETIPIPFTVCLYLSMSSSLVNVLIYSFRDPKFRMFVKSFFVSQKHNMISSKTSSQTLPTSTKVE